MKLKIRFTKVVSHQLFLGYQSTFVIYFGNNQNITIDINRAGVLGIRNNSDNPVKITIKSR